MNFRTVGAFFFFGGDGDFEVKFMVLLEIFFLGLSPYIGVEIVDKMKYICY